MKRFLMLLAVAVLLLSSAQAQVQQSPVLDAAFSLVEEGNLFLRRYNELTGAAVQPVFTYGVPYFYGGTKASTVFSKAPNYVVIAAWQSSPLYYKAGQQYVMGFDCAGFTHWVCQQSGLRDHDSLSKMLSADCKTHLFCTKQGNVPQLSDLPEQLQVGDLMVCRRGGSYHVMMYIGTLADYGLTSAEAPELAAYMNYPLVIHCSAHPAYGERFQTQVLATDRAYYGSCQTTDGGVAVSLLCDDVNIAPHQGTMQKQEHHWFELDGGRLLLNVVDERRYDQFAWVRTGNE